MTRIGRTKKNVFSVVLLLLALLFLEIMLRLGGVLYFQFQYPVKPVRTAFNSFSILCLGDSFTQGFGAPQGKSYPEQLQALMKGQTRKNVIVTKEFRINSSTVLKNLRKDIDTHRPNLMVIMTGVNDLWNMENATDSAFGEDSPLGKMDIALSGFRVYKLMKISFLNLKAAAAEKEAKWIVEEGSKRKFGTAGGEKHYILGEEHFRKEEYELALKEYNIVEGLEPENPWIHWRKACVFITTMKEFSLSENELKLTVQYGDSTVLAYAVMLLFQLYANDYDKMQAMIKEMEAIMDARYSCEERVKAKTILRRLSLLRDDQKTLEKVVMYNLSEIIKTAKRKNIKVVLMNYPDGVARRVGDVVERAGRLLGVPVIDNQKIFAEKLKTLRRKDLFASDGHCNAQGYKLIADNISNVLIKERMLDDVDAG